ncbi:AAA family ATPase [Bradyrhizobium sp. USDA 4504]
MSDYAASKSATARPGEITATVNGCEATAQPTSSPPIDLGRQFLERVVVWPGPQGPGWINLHTHLKNDDPSKNGGKDWVVGWPFKTLDDFVSRAIWIEGVPQFYDVWYCTSQQNAMAQNQRGSLKAVRKAGNATSLKAVWIDCDVKVKPADHPAGEPWTHYETADVALKAILAFARKVGLPEPSAIVDSGGGFHVYWISDVALDPATWRPFAEGLKQLLLAEKVLCDTGLTTDSVRILRVPGTKNHKYDPPRPVRLIHMGQMYDFPSVLSVLLGTAPTKSAAKTPSPSLVSAIVPGYESGFENGPDPAFASLIVADDLAAGVVRRSNTLLHSGPVFEKCAFMRHARDTGGGNYDNPLWHLSVLCASFLENGNAIAHEISKGHPTYAHAETQEMYERKLAERAERGIGWPSCATIRGAGCKSCASCPFFAQGKSPLHLTGPVTATVNPGSTTNSPAIWSPADLRVTFSNVRHRRTLYGYDLVRGELTVLGSPGGVGKSSLAIGMAVSIATGKELLEEKIRGSNLKVLLINAEDSTDEIRRRVWAVCLAHGVSEQELDRLFITGADNPSVQGLSLLRTNLKGHSEVDAVGLATLREALQTLSPDVVVLDPLVALCASGNMNDNSSMSLVMRALKRIAAEFDCAVLIVHHTRKGGDAGSADAISGAASIVNLARRAIMPVTPTEKEAVSLGILVSERLRYFRLVDAKSNLAPRVADAPFYHLHSVELPNPEPPTYPLGDSVQAVTRVHLPPQATAPVDGEKIRQAILDLVRRGKQIDGQYWPYSPSAAGADNARSLLDDAVGAAASATAPHQWAPVDLAAVVKNMVKMLRKDGTLVSRDIENGPFRRRQGLQVNPLPAGQGGSDAADDEVAT